MEGPGLALTEKYPALVTLGTTAASTLEKFTPVYRRPPDCTRRSAACLALAGLSPSSSTTSSTGMPPSFPPPCLTASRKPSRRSSPMYPAGVDKVVIKPILTGSAAAAAPARTHVMADRYSLLSMGNPPGWKRLEGEPVFVGHAQVHARIAHEVAGIHANDSIRRDQVIEHDGQRARIDLGRGAGVVIGRVAPQDGGVDALLLLLRRRAVASAAMPLCAQPLGGGLRRGGDVPHDPQRDRAVPANGLDVQVH